jgi:hypothetical protein
MKISESMQKLVELEKPYNNIKVLEVDIVKSKEEFPFDF